jgi:acyl-CoA thioesterase
MSGAMNSSVDLEAELAPIDETWWAWGRAHGGLLLTRLLYHARTRVTHADLRSIYGSFLGSADDRVLRVSTEVMRQGASTATARSVLRQDHAPVVLATMLFGADRATPTLQRCPAPEAAPPDACPPEHPPLDVVPFVQHLEIRMVGAGRPMAGGDDPTLTAWIRMRKPAFDPAEVALILLDAMPPAFYAAATEPVVAPTVDLAAHLTDGLSTADFSDWALVETRTEQASTDWALETIHLWCPQGTLLAAARQTRRLLRSRIPGRGRDGR